MDRYDFVVIGSGPAGEKAAAQAAYFGKTVALVERNAVPGGAPVNTGGIPSKPQGCRATTAGGSWSTIASRPRSPASSPQAT